MKKSKITDFDPESIEDPAPSSSEDENSDDDVSEVEDANAGREHYAAVGKSSLRHTADAAASREPLYKGQAVSRKELEDSDSDDPFAKGFNEDDSEEEEDVEDGMNGLAIDGEEDESEDDQLDDDEDMDSEDMDSEDMDGSGSDDEEVEDQSGEDNQASEVRSLMKGTKAITSTLAAGAQSDIAKGQAVKTQRKTFDTLLNTRIRLQKALISTNSMAAEDSTKTANAPPPAVEAAEAAALNLLTNLTNLRATLEEARTGIKRKRPTFDASTPSAEIWKSMSSSDKSALPHRKAVLERWSAKTRATTVTNAKNRLNASATQTLTEVLDAQLNSSHLVTRTQIPRSCAPIQSSKSAKGSEPIPEIYDDADFYGLMLKELLEQRSASDGAAEFVVQAPWQVAREAKTRKVVDTKASKGRRLRYTVQEKLQNFMAPEDRGMWREEQRDELFGGLFGQRKALDEREDVVSDEDEMDGADEAGLVLFRN